jgi:hypothetical protein
MKNYIQQITYLNKKYNINYQLKSNTVEKEWCIEVRDISNRLYSICFENSMHYYLPFQVLSEVKYTINKLNKLKAYY